MARFAAARRRRNGTPLETWVFHKDRDAGFHDFAVPVKEAMAFYSEFIGPFSYEARQRAVQLGERRDGGRLGHLLQRPERDRDASVRWRNVIIHEIAHQWWGNAVTEKDWNDVWLSGGFATYFTLLFIEHAYGRDAFADGLRDLARR
ncbi:MAG: hypothetical protein IPP20_10995 [Gemmatimonadetes bacterium]|nr:hypothetical protein [Gemmatimonadota bacterium]